MARTREEILKAKREYYRKWRAANPEKVAETNRRFWEKKAQQLLEAQENAKKTEVNRNE